MNVCDGKSELNLKTLDSVRSTSTQSVVCTDAHFEPVNSVLYSSFKILDPHVPLHWFDMSVNVSIRRIAKKPKGPCHTEVLQNCIQRHAKVRIRARMARHQHDAHARCGRGREGQVGGTRVPPADGTTPRRVWQRV